MAIAISNPVTVNVGKDGSGTASKKVTLNTAGTYVDQNIEVTSTVTATKSADANGSITGSAVAGQTYTAKDDLQVGANGSIYINQGWYDNTKIEIKDLANLEDDPDYANAGASHIRKNYEAYDVDGVKLIGTMEDVSPQFSGGGVAFNNTSTTTSASASISSTGTLKSASSYGVTTTKPSGTDGTDYFTIDGTISKTDGSYSVKATPKAVTYKNAYVGYLNVASGQTALASMESLSGTKTVTATVGTTDNFDPLYIPKAITTYDIDSYGSQFFRDGYVDPTTVVTQSIANTSPSGMNRNYFEFYSFINAMTTTAGLVAENHYNLIEPKHWYIRENGTSSKTMTVSEKSKASVTITGSATAQSGVNLSPSTGKGVLSSAPSSGNYLTINGTYTSTSGTASGSGNVTTDGGLDLGSSFDVTASDASIGVTVTNSSPKYIPVYDGTYNIT